MREMKIKFAAPMGFDLRMHQIARYARCAEESGFSYLAFVDTPAAARDGAVRLFVGIG